jgi:hypothetical protein
MLPWEFLVGLPCVVLLDGLFFVDSLSSRFQARVSLDTKIAVPTIDSVDFQSCIHQAESLMHTIQIAVVIWVNFKIIEFFKEFRKEVFQNKEEITHE